MSADIVRLDDHRPPVDPGNGARQTVDRFLDEHDLGPPLMAQCGTLLPCDYFLAWLWQEGFKVVPVEKLDEPR